jgi:hypothetical protein
MIISPFVFSIFTQCKIGVFYYTFRKLLFLKVYQNLVCGFMILKINEKITRTTQKDYILVFKIFITKECFSTL